MTLVEISRMGEALKLQREGFRVFPLHRPIDAGCSCGKPECTSIGKHPRISEWQKQASSEESKVRDWWTEWPEANIAIATGDGLVVVDLDSEDAVALAEELGWDETTQARTSRGMHLYFYGDAPTRAGLYPGIDIRGEGGYVVAPPSLHASGTEYSWLNDPFEAGLAHLPEWATRSKPKPKNQAASGMDGVEFSEGERNDGLFRLGSAMRGIGMTGQEVRAALRVASEDRCSPPLEVSEVDRIATQVASAYDPNKRFDATRALPVGPYACTVYVALSKYADYDGVCWPRYETLAADTSIGRTRVIQAVKELEAASLIHVVRGGFEKSNRYTLLSPESTAQEATEPEGDQTVEEGRNGTWKPL